MIAAGHCCSNVARDECHRVAAVLRLNDCSRAAAMALRQRTRVVVAAMWPKNHTLNWCLAMCQAHYDGVCQDRFFTDLISTRGLGVRGWSSGKTEMLRSVVALPE